MNKTPRFLAAASGDTLTLTCYGIIGADWDGDGITEANFKAALDANPTASNIMVRVNSPGGDAFCGIALYNLLKSYNKPIAVFVDGLAASAASIVAMAASPGKLSMGRGSMAMIHNAMAFSYGGADDLRKDADLLDQVSDSIADVYVSRTGIEKPTISAYMSAETWFSADEWVTAGFADCLSDDDDDEDGGMENVSVKAFNRVLKQYKNLPDALKGPAKRTAKANTKAKPEPVEVTPEPSNLSLYAAKAKLRRAK